MTFHFYWGDRPVQEWGHAPLQEKAHFERPGLSGADQFVWAERHEGYWRLGFAHSAGRSSPPDRRPEWSQLVKADDEFNALESFAFPPALIEAFHGYSASGGAWGPDGRLYVTGHDEPRLYALSLPVAGSELVWEETIAIPAEGQGFAWDPEEPWVIYTLERSRQEIVVSRIPH